jgi:phage host-nuclease inhibitor protein Gam
MVDIFGKKTQALLGQAQDLLREAQDSMAKDIEALQHGHASMNDRIARLEAEMEKQKEESSDRINDLQQSVDALRDSAIRGEVASGQKTKDVANKFNLTSARVSQIAPRRKYSNG